MATTITVLHNQSFQDISVQHTGSVFNAFSIASENDMSVSEILTPGTSLIIPENNIDYNDNVLQYFQSRKLQPATSLTDLGTVVEKKGIGFMKIGSTFKTD